ncbi:hypothetical protein H5410_049351 [Solanum commersonii]|uniref:Uncharacterized protein n=1 Tax=Solanum commersonii TaxID=4109 RepID=A0A9J5WUD7_SOLCO|nr:hypothetical protein H5410_049351 [Solanum commersonii]
MLQILGAFGGCTDSTDRLQWKLNSKGVFLVKSVYWQLNQKRSCKGELALETSLESEYPYEGVILCPGIEDYVLPLRTLLLDPS